MQPSPSPDEGLDVIDEERRGPDQRLSTGRAVSDAG